MRGRAGDERSGEVHHDRAVEGAERREHARQVLLVGAGPLPGHEQVHLVDARQARAQGLAVVDAEGGGLRPVQARGAIRLDQQVEASAQRIRVQQHDGAVAARGPGEPGGEARGACPAAPSGHADQAGAGAGAGELGKAREQLLRGRGQRQDREGAGLEREGPQLGGHLLGGEDDDQRGAAQGGAGGAGHPVAEGLGGDDGAARRLVGLLEEPGAGGRGMVRHELPQGTLRSHPSDTPTGPPGALGAVLPGAREAGAGPSRRAGRGGVEGGGS